MMTFWKKINNRLLENYPLLWHSKFVQMLSGGVLLWIVSYILGFLITDKEDFVNQHLTSLYGEKYYVFFHMIVVLIVLSFWAISYFKNNAIKSFYPVSKAYLIRLFFLLFIPFIILISAYIPFTAGVFTRFNTSFSQEEIKEDWKKLNYGVAFLVNNSNDYKLNLTDLGYSNLDYFYFEGEDAHFRDDHDYYVNDSTQTYQNDYYPENRYKDLDPKDWKTSVIDDKEFCFFTYVEKFANSDSCVSNRFILNSVKVNEEQNKHWYALENYDSRLFSYPYFQTSREFNQEIRPKIRSIVRNNNKKAVVSALNDVKDLCQKYRVNCSFNPELIANYLEAKKYRNLSTSIMQNNSVKYSDFNLQPIIQKYKVLQAVDSMDQDELIEMMENENNLDFDTYQFDRFYDNYSSVQEGLINSEIWGFVFFAFFLTFLFLVFEFANIIQLLIAIPSLGVLAILVGVTIAFVSLNMLSYDYNYESRWMEKFILTFIFSVMSLIVGLTLYFLYKKGSSKKFLNILFHMTVLLSPFYLNVLLGVFYVFSGYRAAPGRCDDYPNYEYGLQFLLHPIMFLTLGLIGVFTCLSLVKKWKAKEE